LITASHSAVTRLQVVSPAPSREADVVDRDRAPAVAGLDDGRDRLPVTEPGQDRVVGGELLEADPVQTLQHGVDRRVTRRRLGGLVVVEAGPWSGGTRSERHGGERRHDDDTTGAGDGSEAASGGGHGAARLRRYRWRT
jgi:hypothetical protein